MSEHHLCAICTLPVDVSTDPMTWGFEYGEAWLHYHCLIGAYQGFERIRASSRILRNVDEIVSYPSYPNHTDPRRPRYLDHDQVHAEAMRDLGYRLWWYLLWPYYFVVKQWLKLRARWR